MDARSLAETLAEAYPHDFTLQYPPRREYFQERFRARAPVSIDRLARGLLYVHVPFCARKCSYCNFAVDVDPDAARMERYVAAVEKRLEAIAIDDVLGIDIGGGTPTRLPKALLARLLRAVAPFRAQASVPRPLSVETTPEIAARDRDVLGVLREGGVERLSIGLQSSNGATLRVLRRDDAIERHAVAMEHARAAGFARVSVDLIFALPGQTLDAFRRDLERAIALGPDAITTYDCLYRGKGRAMTRASHAPSPAVYGELYELAFATLREAGFRAPYGSLNFSRHAGETGTSAYFEARLRDGLPYIGVGTYATSHDGDAWTFEHASVDAWSRARTLADAYVLPREETMTKHLLLALGFGRIDRARFAARFGEAVDGRYGVALAWACAKGFLREDEEGYGVAAFSALPQVRALLYPVAALSWLAAVRSGEVTPRELNER